MCDECNVPPQSHRPNKPFEKGSAPIISARCPIDMASMNRPKNEAVLDRLRRLQEGRAERERHAPTEYTNQPGAMPTGRAAYSGGSSTPMRRPATALPSPSTADRFGPRSADGRQQRQSAHVDVGAGIAFSPVAGRRPPPSWIYRDGGGRGGMITGSNGYARARDEDGDSDAFHLGLGNLGSSMPTPQPAPNERRTLRAGTSNLRRGSPVVASEASRIRRGGSSAAPIASSPRQLAQQKPQWVGSSSNANRTTPLRPASPMGLNRTGVRRGHTPLSSPRNARGASRAEAAANNLPHGNASLQRGGYSRGGTAEQVAKPRNSQTPMRAVRAPQQIAAVRGPEGTSSRINYDAADAYEYGHGASDSLRRSGAGQVVPVDSAARGALGAPTQRQLFGELQQVVVQLSQTALGDQQRISSLTGKIREYEALLMDQEQMIEELEELNVKLVSERNSLRSFGGSFGSRPSTALEGSAAAPNLNACALDAAADARTGPSTASQQTIVSSMIHSIREEKRQRLLVEETSSKIIAEQQLAIHRLEQQLRDSQRGAAQASSSRVSAPQHQRDNPSARASRASSSCEPTESTNGSGDVVPHPSDAKCSPTSAAHFAPHASRTTGAENTRVSLSDAFVPFSQPSSSGAYNNNRITSHSPHHSESSPPAPPSTDAPNVGACAVVSVPSATDEASREGSLSLVADEAKRAFTHALQEAGIHVSSQTPTLPADGLAVEGHLQLVPISRAHASSIAECPSSRIPHANASGGSQGAPSPTLLSNSSQPHIPRLSLGPFPQRSSALNPPYTVVTGNGRGDSRASSRASVVSMSDVNGSEAQRSPSAQSGHMPGHGEGMHFRSGSVVSVSVSQSQAPLRQGNSVATHWGAASRDRADVGAEDGPRNVCDASDRSGAMGISTPTADVNAREAALGFLPHSSVSRSAEAQRGPDESVLIPCGGKAARAGGVGSSLARQPSYGADGHFGGRASPDPYDASMTPSAMHTARSMGSQCSTRSTFLRHTSASGASLAPDSPPRGAIGQAAAMDKILEDIKKRHNL